MGEDNMTLVSPKMYGEYVLPRIEKIAEKFGGVFLHACGDIRPYLDIILASEWIRGIHFMAWTSPVEAIIEKASGKVPLVPLIGYVDYWSTRASTPMVHQLERILASLKPDTSVFVRGDIRNIVLDGHLGGDCLDIVATAKDEVTRILDRHGLLCG